MSSPVDERVERGAGPDRGSVARAAESGRTTPPAPDPAERAAAEAAILTARPDLRGAAAVVHAAGWDCLAIEQGGSLFKFPRTAAAEARLEGEPVRLGVARRLLAGGDHPALPRMILHRTPRLFSEHPLIAGTMLDPAGYHALGEDERERLAGAVAGVYLALHAADPADVAAAGVAPVAPWPSAEALFDAVRRRLDPPLLARVADVLGRVAAGPDDHAVFGHFDTHGWNMAFDAASGRLAGLFDFGDAGIGPRHRDLSYPSFISPDLTRRVVRLYVARGGRPVDLSRVFDCHTVLRVIELGSAGASAPSFTWALTDWLAALDRTLSDTAHEDAVRGDTVRGDDAPRHVSGGRLVGR
ncbi:aminoglycoside phosphotransferase family protein [Acuticoccus yangtzensis]|uniref:aminoglycoside phosphotransferase family protein n=1 Tax=Acuticoccus yangtzensis TaxID=1443441 RepID=UPI0009FB3E08|nr:aminoglycoside phosphotransferase family protein [Acuticoccus yangtzensis]